MFGGGYRVALRGVGDEDAALGSRLYIYVIYADAGPADGLEPLSPLYDLSRDLRRAADYEAIVVAYPLQEFLWAEADEDIHLELFFEQLDAGICQLLGYEDLQAATPLFEKTL
jgi:hypothetical protein